MDLDSDPVNCAVNFTIESGDHLHMFDIGRSDGNIIVQAALDREAVSGTFYVLCAALLTHLSKMECPTLSTAPVHLHFKGVWVVYFIFIQNSIEHSVTKQCRP